MSKFILRQSHGFSFAGENKFVVWDAETSQPAAPESEFPIEYVLWAKSLNESKSAVPIDFGIAERAACGNTVCPIAVAKDDAWLPIDARGRFVIVCGLGRASTRVSALAVETGDNLSEIRPLADLLHSHYGTNRTEKPRPAPAPKPKPLSRDELRQVLTVKLASALSRQERPDIGTLRLAEAVVAAWDAYSKAA